MTGIEVSGERLGARSFLRVTSVRRVDVFQGDRPYQRVAAEGQDLGILIDMAQLVASPIQDDVVEIATDRPYGRCIEERTIDRDDDTRLRIVQYETMAQLALDDLSTGLVLVSKTVTLEVMSAIEDEFSNGLEVDEMQYLIVSGTV